MLALVNGWVNLDLIHIDRIAADFLDHLDAITGCASLVGGNVMSQIRAIFLDHLLTCPETASGHNHGLGCDFFRLVLIDLDGDPADFTICFIQLGNI